MSSKCYRRLALVAAFVILPLLAAGCASSKTMQLANKGFSAIEKGELEEAERVLTESLQEDPENAYAILNMGTVYQRTGRFDQAREMFDKVIAMNATQSPTKRSKFIDDSLNLKEIAEVNLKTLPAK